MSDLPVGSGSASPTGDQAVEVAGYADRVIVGSAVVRAVLDASSDTDTDAARSGAALA